MDYNSFLNRDYKSLLDMPRPVKHPGFSLIHALILIAALAVISSLLIFISTDASANKNISLQASAATTEGSLKDTPTSQITLSLSIPPEINHATKPTAIYTQAENKASARIKEAVKQSKNDTQWLTVKVKSGDALASIFKRHHLPPRELHDVMALGKDSANLKHLRPGDIVRFQIDKNQHLQELVYNINPLKSLHIQRQGQVFSATMQVKNIEKRSTYAIGQIKSSLFEAGKDAGLSDTLIMKMVNIFGWDIDFAQDIRKGDQFALIYEEQFLDGKKINDGAILAAEFINHGHTYRALRFTDASHHSDYYTPEGRSMRKAFLRTPVDFRRISSRFGNRHHPILNRMRLHKGVDYAAKSGTPIRASGDGKIIFRGRKGGYGRTIIIQHGGRYSTLYAHMSRFKRGMATGRRVKQGQIIGYVGQSGRATGPHLHYEFRVNGVHRNPLTIRLPNAAPIKKQYRNSFNRTASALLAQLDMHKQTRLAMFP
ncbi:Peptidase, M23/M37 family [hydrothermal vent metagenome]|uniref:Peptidase, M23/M37 family n=1 Tax=hydrothermal vent metagenome TaxID=652676 RepID=A0A3B1BKR3_9ZZZZ